MTIWAIIPLVSALAHAGVLVLVLLTPRRRVHNIFGLYLIAATFWSFTSFMLHLNAVPQQAIFWNEILVLGPMWTLLCYYHFIRAYNNKPGGAGLYIGYGLLLILTVLSFSGYIVRSSYVVEGVLYHDLGISLYIMGAVSLFYISAVMFLLIQKYRGTTDQTERNRTAYLMTGWGILILYSFTNLLPWIAGLPIDHLGSLFNALIIAYAILRYQLLDIRLVIRKGLAYSSLTIFLTGLYLLLFFVFQLFFHQWAGYSLAIATGLAILIALLFNPLRNIIQKWIDRTFFRETYDYRQLLLNFSDKISNIFDLDQLAQNMLDPIVETMHVDRAALLFPDSERGNFRTQFIRPTTNGEQFTNLWLASDNPIVNWLATEGKALRRELIDKVPQFKGLWETERLTFEALGSELLLPIRGRGKLVGILSVGKKRSESTYSDEEVNLMMTMANEVALAIENANMVNSLLKREHQVRQLLTRLVLAQEEERKRISVDLHDSVAQWLAAASYRIQACEVILSGQNNDEARGELTEIEKTIGKSLKELRRVVIDLRPPTLDELGLSHALRKSLEDLKFEGIDYQFNEVGKPVRIPSSVEIAAYRIIQEALTNIQRHAGATKVNMCLQFHPDRLFVEVSDNGKGFNFDQTMDSAISVGHIGLLGMKQRAETLGGDIKIETIEGVGTTITLSLPIQPQKEGK